MFKYSSDSYIASTQQEKADRLIDELCGSYNLQYSKDIEALFDKATFAYLEEFHKLVKQTMNEKIVIACVPRSSILYTAQQDIKKGLEALEKPYGDGIPYIEHSFAEDYNCPHGDSFRHCFFFFFTKYHEFEASEECVKYYLKRVNQLKAFL
jgi:hypothetical protein